MKKEYKKPQFEVVRCFANGDLLQYNIPGGAGTGSGDTGWGG